MSVYGWMDTLVCLHNGSQNSHGDEQTKVTCHCVGECYKCDALEKKPSTKEQHALSLYYKAWKHIKKLFFKDACLDNKTIREKLLQKSEVCFHCRGKRSSD